MSAAKRTAAEQTRHPTASPQGASLTRKAPGRHVYDAIVIGGQLSGAIAAALLARRGMQTLYVPHDGLGEKYTFQGFTYPHAPFLLPPVKSVPAFEEVLTELGLVQPVSRLLHSVPLQLLEQSRWFELNHDEKHRGPELARALGENAEAFDELVRKAQAAGDASDSFFQSKPDFPPEGFFGKWKFKRSLSKFPALPTDTPLETSALLRKLERFLAPSDRSAALTRARVLGRTLSGPLVHDGGREGLWGQLAERARELGADVLQADELVDRLAFDGPMPGVRLSRSDKILRAGVVIAAMDLDVLTPLVPEKQQKAVLKFNPLTVQKAIVSFHFLLPESALPRGLGRLSLVDAPKLEGGVVLLEVHPGPTPQQRVLTASVEAPVGLRAGGEPAVRALAQQIHASLERVMPFTKAHITAESSPWIDAQPVVAARGEPHPLFTTAQDAWLGVAGVTTTSPWKRVLLAGRQVLPGLGFEGEVLAAQRAVRIAEATLKKNDPLKQRRSA